MSKEALRSRIKRMLKKHGLSGVNKAKRTPKHSKKSHIVLAKQGAVSYTHLTLPTKA